MKNSVLGGPPRETRYSRAVTPPARGAAIAALLAVACVIAIAPASSRAQPHVTTTRSRGAAVSAQAGQRRTTPAPFPHDKHVKLFPTCVGCHADVTANTTAALFPPQASCATCHNGTDAKRVEWRPPARPAPQGLLRFSHREHFAEADSATRQCASCHQETPGSPFMAVAAARPEGCLGCHEHRAASHYAPDNRCTRCHVPLTQAVALGAADVAALPKPASHDARGFVADHAPRGELGVAQCATCHARESCERCHMNAATLREVAALGTDARVAAAMRDKAPAYPVPDDHRREGFAEHHGPAANASGATCANCHARSSCAACHTGSSGADAIRRLPQPSGRAQGVRLTNPARLSRRAEGRTPLTPSGLVFAADTGARPVRAHARGFLESHRFSAAASATSCEGCHTQRFCTDCHAGETRRAFHPANFVASHASDVYARDRDCSSCHNTEVFCRDCHRASGLTPRGRQAGVYHTAQSQWLLQHGRAARQELTTCATCHRESTCLRCHATTGWGVSPHGDNFDAGRLGKRAMTMCARCHITDPRRR